MTIHDAYAACQRITRRAGSSFYYGIRLLPAAKRRALYAVYAWSRLCDDAVDEFPPSEASSRLSRVQDLLQRALGDEFASDPHPVVQALGHTIRRFRLPTEPFYGLLEGMQMDLALPVFDTFHELKQYCERVAGTVGRLCVDIFGYTDPAARDLAVDMGVALQLTNILRDLKEDVARGRVYLPRQEMAACGYSLEHLRAGRRTPAFERLMALQVSRAKEYYGRAEGLFGLVSGDARVCLRMLHGIYRELLTQIEACHYDVFHGRIGVPIPRKLRLAGSLLWQRQSG